MSIRRKNMYGLLYLPKMTNSNEWHVNVEVGFTGGVGGVPWSCSETK